MDGDPFREYDFAYDLAGNRTQQVVEIAGSPTTTNYTYDAANRLTAVDAQSITNNNAGQMTADGTLTYSWDRGGRLLGAGGSSYEYNGLGNRLSQTVSAVVTDYLLDLQPGLSKVLAATTGANVDRFVHTPQGIHAQHDATNGWGWMIQDALGSVRGVVDSNLDVDESRHYAPYGEPWGVQGSSQTDFGFTGEPTDDNGLVHLRARYLNPVLGVFPSLDPVEGVLQQAMSLNRYGYVAGNVLNLFDPSGMISEDTQSPSLCQSERIDCHIFCDSLLGIVVGSEITKRVIHTRCMKLCQQYPNFRQILEGQLAQYLQASVIVQLGSANAQLPPSKGTLTYVDGNIVVATHDHFGIGDIYLAPDLPIPRSRWFKITGVFGSVTLVEEDNITAYRGISEVLLVQSDKSLSHIGTPIANRIQPPPYNEYVFFTYIPDDAQVLSPTWNDIRVGMGYVMDVSSTTYGTYLAQIENAVNPLLGLTPGDSGSGIFQDGFLIGVAIANAGDHSGFRVLEL